MSSQQRFASSSRSQRIGGSRTTFRRDEPWTQTNRRSCAASHTLSRMPRSSSRSTHSRSGAGLGSRPLCQPNSGECSECANGSLSRSRSWRSRHLPRCTSADSASSPQIPRGGRVAQIPQHNLRGSGCPWSPSSRVPDIVTKKSVLFGTLLRRTMPTACIFDRCGRGASNGKRDQVAEAPPSWARLGWNSLRDRACRPRRHHQGRDSSLGGAFGRQDRCPPFGGDAVPLPPFGNGRGAGADV